MDNAPFDWTRGPRSTFKLDARHGLYALFLRSNARLNGIEPGLHGLLYIGLAANQKGLAGRCHFDKARTRNHSPRKSFAALLIQELNLVPVLIEKPSSPNTWGLDKPSDERLTQWMHANLDVAIYATSNPAPQESALLARLAPPLNLQGCTQSAQHQKVSAHRAKVMASLR